MASIDAGARGTARAPEFPPLEVFVRRPPLHVAPFVRGRHPKTFTQAAAVQSGEYQSYQMSSRGRAGSWCNRAHQTANFHKAWLPRLRMNPAYVRWLTGIALPLLRQRLLADGRQGRGRTDSLGLGEALQDRRLPRGERALSATPTGARTRHVPSSASRPSCRRKRRYPRLASFPRVRSRHRRSHRPH